VPAELAAAIKACPSPETSLTFLTNEWGRPFTSDGFYHWFHKQIEAAGLGEHCVPHGLRKASQRIMAEHGCTTREIMAISGHRTLKEVERYTRAVDNRKLAERARAKVAAANNVLPLPVASGNDPRHRHREVADRLHGALLLWLVALHPAPERAGAGSEGSPRDVSESASGGRGVKAPPNKWWGFRTARSG